MVVEPMMASSDTLKILLQFMVVPSADPGPAAEDALRPEEQDHDQHGQRAHGLQLGRDPQRGDLDEQPDDEAAEQRAPGRAEAAEGHRGEDEQQDLEAHPEADALEGAEDGTAER